ncbi:putative transcription regulator protein [uncultured delta proteobacterium]|uniref:Putative transcription regulator protein n=1 Tax=uncultured delta proteobacterium TaxID=34034 RepID=A0A212KA82_9DELT|nr:putative transcription regulator protein [uncultured delta proteobacterium]
MDITFERPQPLAKLVSDKLRTAIVEGAFSMGQPLSENMLAKLFNISKTPIKHALTELRNEGIVEIIPQKGTYVFTVTSEDVAQLCDMREILEAKALQTAYEKNKTQMLCTLEAIYNMMLKTREAHDTIEYLRLDSSYHQAIMDLSKNPYLINGYKGISVKTRAILFHLADSPLDHKDRFEEHGDILQNLKDGNLKKAVSIIQKHVQRLARVDFSRLEDFGARNMALLSQAFL